MRPGSRWHPGAVAWERCQHTELLSWFTDTAQGDELTVSAVVAPLRDAGCRQAPDTEPFLVHLSRPLDDVPDVPPPAGFRLAHVTDHDGVRRVTAHRAAFAPSRVKVESYTTVRAAHPYRDVLDVVVEAASRTAPWPRTGAGASRPPPPRRHCAGCGTSSATTAAVSPSGDAAYPVPRRLHERLGFRVADRDLVFRHTRR